MFYFSRRMKRIYRPTLSIFTATAHYLVSAWSILRPRAESRIDPDARAISIKVEISLLLLVRASCYSLTSLSSSSYLRSSGSCRKSTEVDIVSENFVMMKIYILVFLHALPFSFSREYCQNFTVKVKRLIGYVLIGFLRLRFPYDTHNTHRIISSLSFIKC